MNRIATLLLFALAVFLIHTQSAAQVNYSFSSSSGAYTAITGGTVLFSGPFDAGTPSTVSLPAAFTFANSSPSNPYSGCSVSIEGWISFGGTNPGPAEITPISTFSTAEGFIAPFGANLARSLAMGSTPEIRWQQVGNEIIFQWQDVRRSGIIIDERFSFQARLNTVTGEIKFVYGTSSSIDGTVATYPQVGLRGTTNAHFVNRAVAGNWAASTVGGSNSATCTFSNMVAPASGLTYTWTPGPNVGVIAVSGVSSGLLLPVGSSREIHALVKNFAPPSQPPIPVFYSVNGGPRVGPVSIIGTLVSTDTQTVHFTGGNAFTPMVAGTYTIKVFTDISSELVRANDTTTITNVYVQTPITSFPYYEKFTSATAWTTAGTANWTDTTGTNPDGTADTLAKADFFSTGANNQMYYRSPLLNLPPLANVGGGPPALLHFFVAHQPFGSADDTLQVVVSTNGGATWSVLPYDKRTLGTLSLATVAAASGPYSPAATSDWRHETVNLNAYAGSLNISIAFLARSGFGDNCFIDNVSIVTPTDYIAPTVTVLGTVSPNNGITFNFTAGAEFPGTLHSARFTGTPPTIASPPFATNDPTTGAQAPDGSRFTPNVVSGDRWWTVTYSADAINRNTYSVSINLIAPPAVPNILQQDKLYIVKRADKSGSWVALTTSLALGVLTASGLSGFSDFGIASRTEFNPLPIQLSSFAATVLSATSVRLNWTTASELNNYGFYVERRSGTQGAFTEVPSSFIAGHGTTNEQRHYTFTDNTVPSAGSYQYRLRQVDLDGAINYTEPISVTTSPTAVNENEQAPKEFALFQNYPNPFNPSTEIKFSVEKTGQTTLEVYNIIGQKVATLFNGVAEAGQYHRVTLNAADLASGMYMYRLQTGEKTSIRKMLLLR